MKRLLNTLYVSTPSSYLAKENEQVVVKVDRETKTSIPIHILENIVCMGQVSCSPALMGLCAERGVGLAFVTEQGRFLARVQGPVSGNVLLRRAQYRAADDASFKSRLAARFVVAKIANTRTLLLRAHRENPENEGANAIRSASVYLADTLGSLKETLPLESVRGKEGDAARMYFSVFDHLILMDKKDFVFRGRSRRPPMDNVNAMLSFLYTLLAHDCVSALECVGLDPAVGFLHADRPGRPSLALDLMEEIRSVIVDRIVLSLINRKQVKASGFEQSDVGGVTMNDATRKILLTNYQERKQDELIHPFLQEKIRMGLLPYAQSMLLARYLRGDLEGYPPFRWK
ncbi:MAG: type I-C CRISPR-associated endonuclease Cas1 [Synergistaceae bacterium]|nr:type I-C CRISPR-associated endonuclease Cas1 [Synergistaceae bacterium]MBP9625842.1 type I-C CRISPR-associated endonuclease Cas1 [Synergistaceae bacterium]MBP9958421.1 type I-C CRISPR-associated endonuclease Cas1 [Synergistaceae bacterium]